MNTKDIVKLWHKTQVGNIHKCRGNQLIFSEIMWNLYEKLEQDNKFLDYQCTGDEVI